MAGNVNIINGATFLALSVLLWLVRFADGIFDSECREYFCNRRSCRSVTGSISRENCRKAHSQCRWSQCNGGSGYGGGGSGYSCTGSDCGPIAGYVVGGIFAFMCLIFCIVGIVVCCAFTRSRSRQQTYHQPYAATTIQPQPVYNAYNTATYPSPAYDAPATGGAQTSNFDYVV